MTKKHYLRFLAYFVVRSMAVTLRNLDLLAVDMYYVCFSNDTTHKAMRKAYKDVIVVALKKARNGNVKVENLMGLALESYAGRGLHEAMVAAYGRDSIEDLWEYMESVLQYSQRCNLRYPG